MTEQNEKQEQSQKPKINYVIATWDGKTWNKSHIGSRGVLDKIGNPTGDEVLACHLKYLSKLEHNLSQITIMKPTEHNQPKYDQYYTKFEKAMDELKFTCPVVMYETSHYTEYSYGQWFDAYELSKNEFDYYIFTEDDIVASVSDFDSKLVDEFNKQIPQGLGYLCSKVLKFDKTIYTNTPNLWEIEHAAISTGITNTKTLKHLEESFESTGGLYEHLQHQAAKYSKIGPYGFGLGCLMQVNFSLMFTATGGLLKDYSDTYLSPFWDLHKSVQTSTHCYEEFTTSKEKTVPLLMPVTMVFDEKYKK